MKPYSEIKNSELERVKVLEDGVKHSVPLTAFFRARTAKQRRGGETAQTLQHGATTATQRRSSSSNGIDQANITGLKPDASVDDKSESLPENTEPASPDCPDVIAWSTMLLGTRLVDSCSQCLPNCTGERTGEQCSCTEQQSCFGSILKLKHPLAKRQKELTSVFRKQVMVAAVSLNYCVSNSGEVSNYGKIERRSNSHAVKKVKFVDDEGKELSDNVVTTSTDSALEIIDPKSKSVPVENKVRTKYDALKSEILADVRRLRTASNELEIYAEAKIVELLHLPNTDGDIAQKYVIGHQKSTNKIRSTQATAVLVAAILFTMVENLEIDYVQGQHDIAAAFLYLPPIAKPITLTYIIFEVFISLTASHLMPHAECNCNS
eukprot:Lankesteria_metandrocarpae@DN878_c0_g1_i1.p1